MRLTESITIDASAERAFAVFADLEHAGQRLSGVDKIEVLEGPANPLAVGTRWRETRTMMGKAATEEMWVTAADPPHGYEVAASSHGTRYRSAFTFVETRPGQTEVTMTFEGTPETVPAKLMSCLAFLFLGSLRKIMRRDLDDVKAVCESDAG